MISLLIVFLLSLKNIKSLQYYTITSVPLIFALLVIYLIIAGIQPGSLDGVKIYIFSFPKANPINYYSKFGIWSEATQEIFFAFFLSIGLYTAYASYLKKETSFVSKLFGIILLSFLFSILCGFVTFSLLGFLFTQVQNIIYF